MYDKLGQSDKALADFSKVIELVPWHTYAWYKRGDAYRMLNQWDRASADYSKVIELSPKFPLGFNSLAWLLATCPDQKFRDPSRAVELAKKAVELAPKDGSQWNTLGVAQYRAGSRKAASEALNKSMALEKGGNSFDWFFLAMAHWHLGERDQAREWYRQAIGWMKKNQANNEELRRFRAEAEALLEIKNE